MGKRVPDEVYVAVAYRWGHTNTHWYLVAGGTKRSDIVDAARLENYDRGGKYGVAVLRLSAEGSTAMEDYFPSIYGESAPGENPRIAMFQRLGQKVFYAVESGTAALPDSNGSRLTQARVDIPDWLRKEKQRIEEFESAVASLAKDKGEGGGHD